MEAGTTHAAWVSRNIEKSSIVDVRTGRGSAIRLGIRHSQGRVVAIQDADMAYDPADLLATIWPVLEREADAVFGSRRLRKESRKGFGLRASLYGRVNTWLANRLTGLSLSDLDGSHKAFRGELIRSLKLTECEGGLDAELVSAMDRHADVVMEVPTRYEPEFQDDATRPTFARLRESISSLMSHRKRKQFTA